MFSRQSPSPALADRSIRQPAANSLPVELRRPVKSDGIAVNRLIGDIGALDDNSLYCNLLQCSHFADTCAIAEVDDNCIGWASGYRPPDSDDVLFIWQIAVAESAQGLGIGKRLLQNILLRDECRGVSRLQATITADKDDSWGLFGSFARMLDAPMSRVPHFRQDDHFDGRFATEHLVTIGPFERPASGRLL